MKINSDINRSFAVETERLPTPVWEIDPDVWTLFVAIGCLQMALDAWKVFHESLVLQAERVKEGERAEERHPRWARGIGAFQDNNWQAVLVMRQVGYLLMNDSLAYPLLNLNKHLQFPV